MIRFFKHIPFILLCCFISIPAFSQKIATGKKTPAAEATLSAERSKMLCKPWQLDTVSEFGVDSKAKGKEANDGITFIADGSFFITQEGAASTGIWSYTGGRINALTKNPEQKLSFKIVALADTRLVLEYQFPAPDLRKIRYGYSPKK